MWECFQAFSIPVSGTEQLLLVPELQMSQLKPRISIPKHGLSI